MKLLRCLCHPRSYFLVGLLPHIARYIKNDKFFLKMNFWAHLGYNLDLKRPKTFNQKLQWLKLYDRNPLYITLVDKYAVKEYVSKRIRQDYVIPTLGVWDDVDDVDFQSLPRKFVLKTTHDGGGGGVVICRDKDGFDINQAKTVLNKSMQRDAYVEMREWPYKGVPHRIIAEQLLEDDNNQEIKDYKFFCFGGEVKFCKVDSGRFLDHHANYYSPEWNFEPFGEAAYPRNPNRVDEKPLKFSEMLDVAKTLSKGFPFVRIDLYYVNDEIKFGEYTFYPSGGFGRLDPEETDMEWGNYLNLEKINI